MAGVVGEFLSGKTSKSRAIGDLLASDQFRNIITDAVRSGVVKGGAITRKLKKAEDAIEQSAKYQKWADTLNESDKAKLASVGLISYLFDEQEAK